MAGKIVADTLEHSTAGSVTTDFVVNGSAKAWVNFNGKQTSGNEYVRDSLNIGSTVDNGTGNYDFNLSSAMANSTWIAVCGENDGTTSIDRNLRQAHMHVASTTNLDVQSGATNTTQAFDVGNLFIACMGDLA